MMKLKRRSLLAVCSMLVTLILVCGPCLAAASNEVELLEPHDTIYAAGWDNLVYFMLYIVTVVYEANRLSTTKDVGITGTVYAGDWDDNHNFAGVKILTTKYEEIAVSNSGKGVELLKLEQYFVKAIGTISTDETARKTITVVRYEILK